MTIFDEKKCECGHAKEEHLWLQKNLSKLSIGAMILRVPIEGRGLCKKCTCPEFKTPQLLRPKRKMDYQPIENISVGSENRCGVCGRLLENHDNVGHYFKKMN